MICGAAFSCITRVCKIVQNFSGNNQYCKHESRYNFLEEEQTEGSKGLRFEGKAQERVGA